MKRLALALIIVIALIPVVDGDTYIYSPAVDGYVYRVPGSPESFANIIAGAGSYVYTAETSFYAPRLVTTTGTNTFSRNYRGVFSADTSSLPDDEDIESAKLYMTVLSSGTGLGSFNIVLTSGTLTSNASLAAADYQRIGSTILADNLSSSISGANNTWTFTTAGKNYISKTSPTIIFIRSDWDVNAVYTGAWAGATYSGMQFASQDAASSGTRPWFEVVTSTGADTTPPASLTIVSSDVTCSAINFTFTKPDDADYNGSLLWHNGTAQTNLSSTATFDLISGLAENLSVTFSSKTFDNVSNINGTFVNTTATTLAKPVSSFSKNATSGLYPLGIQVNDTTARLPTMWNWSFGDGQWFNTTTSADKNATHVYGTGGTYSIYLITSNGCGANTSASQSVTVNNHVWTDFDSNVTSGTIPFGVQFNHTLPNDNATMWNWSFGDGAWYNTTTAGNKNATHTYSAVGTYPVNFTSSNAYDTNTTVKLAYITANQVPEPDANFTATPLSGTYPPAVPVTFTDTSTNNPTSWLWQFQNESVGMTTFSTEQNPTFSFVKGKYDIYLKATNAGGDDEKYRFGYINISDIAAPDANFTATPLSGTYPPAVPVTFTDLSTNSPTSWVWQYQNATVGLTVFSTDQNPTFSFVTGEYDIVLTATNSGGNDVKNRFGYISIGVSPPVADFTADDTEGYAPSFTVTFTDTSTNDPTSWAWDFDNNGSTDDTDQNPSFEYTVAGTYTVKLTASNAGGGDAETKVGYITVHPEPPAPTASFTSDVTTGYSPLTVQFTDTSTDLPTGWAWYWYANETVSSTDQDPAAIFSAVGLYSVRLYASNAQGGDWYNETDYIEVKSGAGYHMRPKASSTLSRVEGADMPEYRGTYVMREKATATMVTIAAEGRLINILDGLGLGNTTPSNTTVIDPTVMFTESAGVFTDILGPGALVILFLIPFSLLFISQRSMRGASVLGVLASLFVFMYLPANYTAGAVICIVISVGALGYSLWKGQG